MSTTQVKRFKGLNNVSDPLRLGVAWLVKANNVNITDTGAIEKRGGYAQVQTGAFTGAYTTLDFQRMYLVDGGVLRTYDGSILKTGLSAAPMYWAEINDQVFYNNGVDRGVILPDNQVLDWAWPTPSAPNVAIGTGTLPEGIYQVRCSFVLPGGRETGTGDSFEIAVAEGSSLILSNIPQIGGWATNVYIAPANSTVYSLAYTTTATALTWNSAPESLGVDLRTAFLDSIPSGSDVIQFFKGRVYAAQYFPEADQTVVWFSEVLAFHLFNLNSDFFIVPGHVVMLAPTESALVIGTTTRVYAYGDNKLEQVAAYGVVPGQHWSEDKQSDGSTRILFWTTRGVCSALPFTNLTEKSVSVAPGIKAGGTIVQQGGQKRYLVALQQGGSAFNSY